MVIPWFSDGNTMVRNDYDIHALRYLYSTRENTVVLWHLLTDLSSSCILEEF